MQAASKCQILIVDDTQASLVFLSGILRTQGYAIATAKSGREALERARSLPCDLILLDINMPDLDGYEVCRQLKADPVTQAISVVFLSALSEFVDRVRAFQVGGIDYITKPFQAEEVLVRVQTHVRVQLLQRHLQQKNAELESTNDKLTQTIAALESTQRDLVHSEKMAALGQLMAGIAHEINTPMGAIRASIGNVLDALETTSVRLPQLLQALPRDRYDQFADFLQFARQDRPLLSTREERRARRHLHQLLAAQAIADAEPLAEQLARLGMTQDLEPHLDLLRSPQRDLVLDLVRGIVGQKINGENIRLAVERASKIIFALKSYSHQAIASQPISAQVVDGIEVVLTIYHNLLKQGIEVIKRYGTVPEIDCYPDELNQVWMNLIHNAIQAMNGSGILEIEVCQQGDRVLARFTDSGCGIPSEIRDRIFEPFFTTKPSGEGSGLGLDIVRQIVVKHRGEIALDSVPGRTTFSVHLPIARLEP